MPDPVTRPPRGQVPLPDGAPLRRADRDVPRHFWRLMLLGLLALCLLHVAGLTIACVTAGTILPLVQAATGQDGLTTDLLGLVLLALTWVTKRQGNRTEALAGRGPARLHAKVDDLRADTLAASAVRDEQLAAFGDRLDLLTHVLLGGQGDPRRGRHVPTGTLPAVSAPPPASGGYVPPPDVTWEQITTGDLPPTR